VVEGDEHRTCHVRTFGDWLRSAEYPPTPQCAVCHAAVTDDDSSGGGGDVADAAATIVRLACLELAHVRCIREHGAKLPPETAQAGFVCPSCAAPLFVSPTPASPILRALAAALADEPWAAQFVTQQQAVTAEPQPKSAESPPATTTTAAAAISVPLPLLPPPPPSSSDALPVAVVGSVLSNLPLNELAVASPPQPQGGDEEDGKTDFTAIAIPPLGAVAAAAGGSGGIASRKPNLLSTLPLRAEYDDEDK
jgi:hypothetical protein